MVNRLMCMQKTGSIYCLCVEKYACNMRSQTPSQIWLPALAFDYGAKPNRALASLPATCLLVVVFKPSNGANGFRFNTIVTKE